MADDIRITTDDFVPKMRDAGIVAKIEELALKNCPLDVLLWEISQWSGADISWEQLRYCIADLITAGAFTGAGATPDIVGYELPPGQERPAAPSGLGCANGNVWCTPPETPYVLRFYVNGMLKSTFNDYYITSLESIGAVAGDIVQICQVSAEGVVGWWARTGVP